MAKENAQLSVFQKKLVNYIKAAYPALLIESHEEKRLHLEVRDAVVHANAQLEEDNKYRLGIWNRVSGLQWLAQDKLQSEQGTEDFEEFLGFVRKNRAQSVFILNDAHHYMDPVAVRHLRNLLAELKSRGSMLILVSPEFKLPAELSTEVQPVAYALPTKAELGTIFHRLVVTNVLDKPEYKDLKITPGITEAVVEAASGMTMIEAENAMSLAVISRTTAKGAFRPDAEFCRLVFEEKIAAMQNSFLDYIPTPSGFESVGGLQPIKDWAMKRRVGFEPAAQAACLPYPKGVLVTGIPGCGKTVTAMAVAAAWGFPLYKLDLGRLFGSLVGQSESNMRSLIRLLEGIGRAVILIDELDKFLNTNAVSGASDSGTSSRMFGAFLTWLAGKKVPVFFIGTMNNTGAVPPELMRKGRFDAVFFVDLPGEEERFQIFNSLLEHRFKSPIRLGKTSARCRLILEASADFSGAEIESAIGETIYAQLSSTDKDKDDPDWFLTQLHYQLKSMTSQAAMNPDRLKQMRDQIKQGFVRANSQEVGQSLPVGRNLTFK